MVTGSISWLKNRRSFWQICQFLIFFFKSFIFNFFNRWALGFSSCQFCYNETSFIVERIYTHFELYCSVNHAGEMLENCKPWHHWRGVVTSYPFKMQFANTNFLLQLLNCCKKQEWIHKFKLTPAFLPADMYQWHETRCVSCINNKAPFFLSD